ncbi:iron complex transport system ATP-binding protein [Cryobacterium mesophilum]|uniref:ABC transporter ATP-binding protein n=1 Tax=Terrimesophilobacter mesophilus TaxID=433647 RepID=A0A4R8VES4_9MICO|nr:ABC transporter ATP-binding protein [Terrimesophilobacter mesophilus]MBB5633655.1 iron complex transport system ATP-binding protein [Terrimesophilobacter mesophilus]TFB80347.1 ABC transporter ATP-binding protein [Terrimesophilobacter mesophilus]
MSFPESRSPQGLTAAGLTLSYGSAAVVHAADLRLTPRKVTALVGPNGSGKSTLLRAIAGLHRPQAGTIILDDGADALMLRRSEFARRLTLLSQSRTAPSGISVRDVVEFGRHPHRGRWRSNDPDGAASVARAMTVTGVDDLADRSVEQLSGGQLQRVWLASCLAQDTGILLLDEPTTFLDLRYQVETLDLIRDLADHHDVTIGVVLHDLDQAAAVADDVVLLSEGRVVASGPADDVFTPDRLTAVYGIRIDVDTDPFTGGLRTRAIGRHHSRSERLIAAP